MVITKANIVCSYITFKLFYPTINSIYHDVVFITVAIYFDDLSGNNIEYTIRLRTETGAGTWNTDSTQRLFTAPGPTTNPTYATFI